MKSLIKIIIFLPLIWLGGCYTQFAVHYSHSRDYTYEDEPNYDEDDSLAYEERYDYDEYYYNQNLGYRRFLLGYYPSSSLILGFGLMPYWYPNYGYSLYPYYYYYDYYLRGGGLYGPYSVWYLGHPYYYGIHNYPGKWNNSVGGGVYRTGNLATSRARNNDFERGSSAVRTRDYTRGSGGSSSVRNNSSGRDLDVDLQRARIGTSGSRSSDVSGRVNSAGENNSPRSSGEVRTRTRSESGNTVNSNTRSERSERSQPVYVPRAERSYSPPTNTSPRMESPSRGANSGSSAGGSDSRSSGSGSSGGDGGRHR